MKVKCPFYPATRKCIEPCPIFVDGKCDMEIKVSTDDLLAELERRRPDCRKCVYEIDCSMSEECIWRGTEDNFKKKNVAK